MLAEELIPLARINFFDAIISIQPSIQICYDLDNHNSTIKKILWHDDHNMQPHHENQP